MTLWLRVLVVFIASLFRPRLGLADESILALRVLPTDLDINVHMNNARYLAVMDLGRFDLILRSGIWRVVHKRRLQPVLGGSLVRFRRPLGPFQRFSLKTRLLGWDERWFYIEQLMESADGMACLALHRAGFVEGGRLLPPLVLAASVGREESPPPPLPAWVYRWTEAENSFVRHVDHLRGERKWLH
jgi:acyl-CoA thioesterase FadM